MISNFKFPLGPPGVYNPNSLCPGSIVAKPKQIKFLRKLIYLDEPKPSNLSASSSEEEAEEEEITPLENHVKTDPSSQNEKK